MTRECCKYDLLFASWFWIDIDDCSSRIIDAQLVQYEHRGVVKQSLAVPVQTRWLVVFVDDHFDAPVVLGLEHFMLPVPIHDES